MVKSSRILITLLMVLILSVTIAGIATAIGPTDYISYYNFNTGSGSTLYDQNETNNNDGTINADNFWSTDYPVYNQSGDGSPSSGSFDGVDDNVEINGINIGGFNSYTTSIWIKTTTSSKSDFFNDRSDVFHFYYRLNSDGTFSYFHKDSSDNDVIISTSQTINDGEWHHIVAKWDGSTIYAYIDGELIDSKSTSSTYGDNNNVVIGGADNNGDGQVDYNMFNGNIDDVTIWDRALSSSEVSDLYNDGLSDTTTYPVSITETTLSPSTIYATDDASGSVTVNDTTYVEIVYQWKVNGNNVSGESGVVTTHSSGTFDIPSIPASNYNNGDTVTYEAYARNSSDGSTQLSTKESPSAKTVQPISITTNSIDQTTVYTDTDVTGTVEVDYDDGVVIYYEWKVNGNVKESGDVSTPSSTNTYDISSMSTQFYEQEDNITLTVEPRDSDGVTVGSSDTSSQVTVQNRDPTIDSLQPSTTSPMNVEDFEFTMTVSDDDGDSIDVNWTLYKNGVEESSGTNNSVSSGSTITLTTVTSDTTSVGDEYYIAATATDPYDGTDSNVSENATVKEARVNITNVDFTNRPVYTTEDTSATYDSEGTESGDYFEIIVYKNEAQYDTDKNTYTLSSSETSQLEDYYYTIQAYDSNDEPVSEQETSPTITIQNNVPTISNLEYSSNDLIEGNSFSIYATGDDSDGDSLNISWTLYRNGSVYQNGTVTGASPGVSQDLYTVPSSEVNAGDSYYFEANATDGIDTSSTSTSDTKTVIEVSDFTITAIDLWTGSGLDSFSADVAFTDYARTTVYTPYFDDIFNPADLHNFITAGDVTVKIPSKCYYEKGGDETLYLFDANLSGNYSVACNVEQDDGSYIGYNLIEIENEPSETVYSNHSFVNETSYSTDGGSIITPINDTRLVNVTVYKTDYFNQSFVDYNTSSNLQAELYQSVIEFDPFELITNNTPASGVSEIPGDGSENSYNASVDFENFVYEEGFDKKRVPDYCFNNGEVTFKTETILGGDYERSLRCLDDGSFTEILKVQDTFSTIYFEQVNVTYTVDGVTQKVFRLSSGSYNVTADAQGYYEKTREFEVNTLDEKTVDIHDIYNNIIRLSVTDTTGDSIDTVWQNDILGSGNVTSGSEDIPALQGNVYDILLGGEDYFAETVEANTIGTNLTELSKSLFFKNKMIIRFVDLDSFSTITDNVNYTIKSDNRTYSGSTTSGEVTKQVINGYYTVTAESSYYQKAQYLVFVPSSDTEQNLTVYMRGDDPLKPVKFSVIDNYDEKVSEATIDIQVIKNGTSYSVGQDETDFSGSSIFYLNPDVEYTVVASKEGYNTFTGKIEPTDDSYTFRIIETGAKPQESIFENLYYTTGYNHDNNTINFTYFISDALGRLTSYSISTEYDDSTYSKRVTDSPSGSLITLSVPYNASIQNRFEVTYTFTVGSEEYEWTETYKVYYDDSYDTDFGDMDDLTKIVISVMTMLFFLAVGMAVAGLQGGYISALLALGVLTITNILSVGVGIAGLTVVIIVLLLINTSRVDSQ